jgi:hypothetical protein
MWIRIQFLLYCDPDADFGQSLPSQKVKFLHAKIYFMLWAPGSRKAKSVRITADPDLNTVTIADSNTGLSLVCQRQILVLESPVSLTSAIEINCE